MLKDLNCLIISGPIASGKSTLAKGLVHLLRNNGFTCSYISLDWACYNLVGGCSYKDRSLALKLLNPTLQELILNGHVPILEGLFCKNLLSELTLPSLYVGLDTPLEICIFRDAQREADKWRGEERVRKSWHYFNDTSQGMFLSQEGSEVYNYVRQNIRNI